MEKICIEEQYIADYIVEQIEGLKRHPISVESSLYHHNTQYSKLLSALKYGLLSQRELMRLGIVSYSEEVLKLVGDITSHVNGHDGISLSKVGLTDLYRDEIEYDPFNPNCADILISDNIMAFKNGQNYGNEFICESIISPKDFRTIDIRLLKYIRNLVTKRDFDLSKAVEKYNSLIQVALYLQGINDSIPLREMSDESNTSLDVEQLSKMPVLVKK